METFAPKQFQKKFIQFELEVHVSECVRTRETAPLNLCERVQKIDFLQYKAWKRDCF